MANKTINGITTELESVASADLLLVWDASEGVTAKVTKSTLLDGMQEELTFDEEPTDSSTNPVTSGGVFSANAVITASSTTLEGVTISSGSVIRVMFTSAITGSDTSTALSLTYNDTAYSVKVGKQGSLSNFVASYVNSTYTYLQAYTTLELAFDGTQFIIIGNPVVLSSSDYTIYADGQEIAKTQFSDSIGSFSSSGSLKTLKSITLSVGKTISGTMMCNLGATVSSVYGMLWARTTTPSTIATCEVVNSKANTPNSYTMLCCPFCFTNDGSDSLTIYLGYYQSSEVYTATIKATYTIF